MPPLYSKITPSIKVKIVGYSFSNLTTIGFCYTIPVADRNLDHQEANRFAFLSS